MFAGQALAGDKNPCRKKFRDVRAPASVLYKGTRIFKTDLKNLRPTQMTIGKRAVDEQADDLRELLRHPKKFEAKLMEEAFPAVIGPDGKIYIIDHHHHEQALERLGIKHGYYTIKADYSGSGLNQEQFWKKLAENHWVHPYDENGRGPLPVAQLPQSFDKLKDDPYRSLAGILRDKGHFLKTTVPFAEFQWADFFRTRLSVGHGDKDFKKALEEAARLTHSQEARDAHLPGYLEKKR